MSESAVNMLDMATKLYLVFFFTLHEQTAYLRFISNMNDVQVHLFAYYYPQLLLESSMALLREQETGL